MFFLGKVGRDKLGCNGIDNVAAWPGRPQPVVYSADLSEFGFDAGVRPLNEFPPDIRCLTTTDVIQHKFAPDAARQSNSMR